MKTFPLRNELLLAAWLGVGAASCGGASDPADERDAGEADAPGADAGDVPITRPCTSATVWGTIEPSEGTLSATGPALQLGLPGWSDPPGGSLRVDVDRAEAETLDGRAVECKRSKGYYYCEDAAGLRSLRVFVGEESSSREIHYRDGVCFSLSEGEPYARTQEPIPLAARACVAAGTVVVEGALRNFAADAPLMVWLVGEYQPVVDPGSNLFFTPYRPCEVRDQRYRCTTLGYDATAVHELRVLQNGQRQSKTVSLQVNACQVEPLQLDLQGPAADAGTP